MAEGVYNRFKLGLAQADEDWTSGVGDYRALLLTGSHLVAEGLPATGPADGVGGRERRDGPPPEQAEGSSPRPKG